MLSASIAASTAVGRTRLNGGAGSKWIAGALRSGPWLVSFDHWGRQRNDRLAEVDLAPGTPSF